MIFTELALRGAFLVDIEPREDDRGYFARSFCREEFFRHGLKVEVAQCNISFNRRKGTLRGMHYQIPPKAEAKLVRCTRGAVHDVIVDLRDDSPTFHRWVGVELSGGNSRSLYIPEGFAHGFQTLEDDSEVFYQMFASYSPDHACGVRWDDPALGIEWPLPDPIVSARDRSFPLLARPTTR
ncbi:MAG: dTDP-4-dehydrorhamnose 3,5-epimerase [Deltaproteobacteria bacterium]|nr:MAG: dTDP-4-dehydrorhamnose 3,5-epimerase [Deltaproteobacteria bacterium]